jgi:hypothetical protein
MQKAIWLLAVLLPLAGRPAVAQQLTAPIRDMNQIFQKRPRSWREIKVQNVVMQGADYSCGAAALATVLRYFWQDNVGETKILDTIMDFLTKAEIKDRMDNGLSIDDLRRAAVELNYLAEVGTITFAELTQSKVPLLVAINANGYDHFVVVRGVFGNNVYLADPMRGNIRVRTNVFASQWTKNAVLVVLKPNVKPPAISPLTVRQREVDMGATNMQVIRTMPPKQYSLPAP